MIKGAEEKRKTFRAQFKEYILSGWNLIDMMMLGSFLVGEYARVVPAGRQGGRIFLSFSLFMFYIRFLHTLTSVRNIGPKVTMIFKSVSLLAQLY